MLRRSSGFIRLAVQLCLACLFAVLLWLELPMPAAAAFWAKITLDPQAPTVGEPVGISVLTFTLTSDRCWDDPSASPIPVATWYGGESTPESLNLRLAARGPDSRQIEVTLVQRKDDGAYLDGEIGFPIAGTWTLFAHPAQTSVDWRHVDTVGNRCAGRVRTIDVSETAGHPASPPAVSPATGNPVLPIWAVVAALLLAGVIFTALLLRPKASSK